MNPILRQRAETMGKASKANGTGAGGCASEEEWHFELIQPIEAIPMKSCITPDHRITGILAALHLLPRGGESSARFAGPQMAPPRLPSPLQRAFVMGATLTSPVAHDGEEWSSQQPHHYQYQRRNRQP